MRQFYSIYEQIIDVSEEEKMKEIEAFINKYHLDYKRSSKEPKASPIWEFFVIFAILNTIIGIIIQDPVIMLKGFIGITLLYLLTLLISKTYIFNIKVN